MVVQLRICNAFSLGLQRFPSQSCAHCWFTGRAIKALGFQFRSSVKRSSRVGFLVVSSRMQAIAFAICVLQGDANSLGSVAVTAIGAHLRKSATGGICETSEYISTNVDERVGHSVTWCFRFPLHAQLCQYHCHMDYAFISVGDIALCRQFASMC